MAIRLNDSEEQASLTIYAGLYIWSRMDLVDPPGALVVIISSAPGQETFFLP